LKLSLNQSILLKLKKEDLLKILAYLSSIGLFIAIAGIASIILSFFNYNLQILIWIDTWGTAIGWVIRIALIVIGTGLFILGKVFRK